MRIRLESIDGLFLGWVTLLPPIRYHAVIHLHLSIFLTFLVFLVSGMVAGWFREYGG